MIKCSISISFHVTLTWCFLLFLNSHSFSSLGNETDRLSLLAIKSQLHDPLGFTSSWNNSINLCQWSGVTCGHRHPRVTQLVLNNQSIGGFLSPYVGNLSFLRLINIAENNFYGEIPHEIGRLIKLETLVLANNSFSGKIPSNLSLCYNLIKFYAHNNELVGEIPPEISSLLKLEYLAFNDNHLIGELPPSIGNISTLQKIFIRGNQLGGRIPSTLGKLRNLVHLNFGRNKFSGIIPPSFYNISSLEYIYLHENRFHGNLPLDIGINLPNIRVFVVYNNNLTDSLPDSLSNASNIELLDLSGNQFKGKVLINFSGLKNLSWLNLGHSNLGIGATNDLDFVTFLTNCSKLYALDLSGSRFGGVLPHSIANLSTKMTLLAMGDNQISGTIPIGISNLVNLNTLSIEYNQLTGTVPHVIGELKNLQLIYLHKNFLQGIIPSSLGNLTILTKLALSSNNLQGNIPSSLGNCKNLILLDLSKNRLIGIKGTIGYVPPEYGMGCELSMAGDVYSFGILLLEMFTRRRPTDNIFNDGVTLHELVKMALPEKIMEVVDPSLLLDVRTGNSRTQRDEKVKTGECLVAVLRTGVMCSTESSNERIQMSDAVSRLCTARKYFLRARA